MLKISYEPPNLVALKASGKLTKADYEQFVPEFERYAEQARPLRVLVELDDFHGWEAGALWHELKFDMQHQQDMGRVAIVGESDVEKWGTKLSKPFFRAKVRYFPAEQKQQARAWLTAV